MNGQIIETKFLRSPIQDSNFGNAISEAILLHSFPDHPDDYSFIFGTNELSNKEMATRLELELEGCQTAVYLPKDVNNLV